MSTRLKPFKGSITWDKASGVITASGTAPPESGASNMAIGDPVDVEMCASGRCGVREGAYELVLAHTPTLTLQSWSCLPIGWGFSASNAENLPRVSGEYKSIFRCYVMQNTLATETSVEEFLRRLAMFTTSQIRLTSSPYAKPGWWKLSDIVAGWSIPSVADVYIESLQAVGSPLEYQIVNQYVPFAGILFSVDAMTKVVSHVRLPQVDVESLHGSQVSVRLLADYSMYTTTDLNGLKGSPLDDPRTEGPGHMEYEIETTDNGDVQKTSIVESFSRKNWADYAMCSRSTHTFHLLDKLGPRPMHIGDDLIDYLSKLIINLSDISEYRRVADTTFENDIEFFNAYSEAQTLSVTDRYVFNRFHPDVSPYTHTSPLVLASVLAEAKGHDVVGTMVANKLGVSGTLSSDLFLSDDSALDLVSGSPEDAEAVRSRFDGSEYMSCRYTTTCHDVDDLCYGDGLPYTFHRKQTVSNTYQAGLFLLNLNSLFWITPDAGYNLGATDPQGRRVWIGPMDDPTGYAFAASTIASLNDLLADDASDTIMHALCVFSSLGYLMRESDIVLAAIADELSIDSPQQYLESYDRYISFGKNWFAGTFSRMQGLQYSFFGRHKGLQSALSLVAERHGVDKVGPIYERLLPGTKIENLNDASGGAYCVDMLKWIVDNGLARVAGLEGGGSLVRTTDPLCEKTVIETIHDGVREVYSRNNITGDSNVDRTPISGHPEYQYISPTYTQLTTLTGASPSGSGGGHFISQVKVLDWDRLSNLQRLLANEIIGKKLYTVAMIEDMTDAPENIPYRIADLLGDPTIRQVKLLVESETSIGIQYIKICTGDLSPYVV